MTHLRGGHTMLLAEQPVCSLSWQTEAAARPSENELRRQETFALYAMTRMNMVLCSNPEGETTKCTYHFAEL